LKTSSSSQNNTIKNIDSCDRIYYLYSKYKNSDFGFHNNLDFIKNTANGCKIEQQFFSGKDVIDVFYFKKTSQNFTNSIISNNYLSISSLPKNDSHFYSQKNKFNRSYNSDWFAFYIFAILIILTWIRFFYKNLIRKSFISIINLKNSESLYREKSKLSDKSGMLLSLIFILNSSILLFQFFVFYKIKLPEVNNFWFLSAIASIIFLLITIQQIFNYIIGLVYNLKPEFSEYNFNIKNYNHVIGLILFPLIIIISYTKPFITPYALFFSIILFIVFHILRNLRMTQIFLKKDISFFYIILYICTFEIIPLALLIIFTKRLIANIF